MLRRVASRSQAVNSLIFAGPGNDSQLSKLCFRLMPLQFFHSSSLEELHVRLLSSTKLISASIAAAIGGNDSYTWLPLVNALALAAVAPFAGHLSDLIGRRHLGILGAALVLVGMIVVGTAHQMNVAIGGMAMAGAGSGIAQVIGIAGVAEVVPVRMRARFLCTIYLIFSPMAPAPGYGFISSHVH